MNVCRLFPFYLAVSPLEKWRQGYLWVSHLVAQQWCEQQMEYGFSRPEEAVEEPQHVIRGTELHLARELQTEDYVDILVESDGLASIQILRRCM